MENRNSTVEMKQMKPSGFNLYATLKSIQSELVCFFKYSYLVFVLVMFFVTIVELKREFQIDLFPGVDTPIDNIYFAQKDLLNNSF